MELDPFGINSLAPRSNFKNVISKYMSISWEIAPRWMLQNTFDDKSTLVQVMAFNFYIFKRLKKYNIAGNN